MSKLLTRSVFPLQKPKQMEWSQKRKNCNPFKEYPNSKKRIYCQQLRNIYNNNTDKAVAITKLAHWYNNMKNLRIKKALPIIMITNKVNHDSILHYFRTEAQMLQRNLSMLK
jgi:hypothetical protein